MTFQNKTVGTQNLWFCMNLCVLNKVAKSKMSDYSPCKSAHLQQPSLYPHLFLFFFWFFFSFALVSMQENKWVFDLTDFTILCRIRKTEIYCQQRRHGQWNLGISIQSVFSYQYDAFSPVKSHVIYPVEIKIQL